MTAGTSLGAAELVTTYDDPPASRGAFRRVTDVVRGDVVVTDRCALVGMVAGSCRVATGGGLHVEGIVVGDLIVDVDALAVVSGWVGGDVVCHGAAVINGVVLGRVVESGGRAQIRPAADVRGESLAGRR